MQRQQEDKARKQCLMREADKDHGQFSHDLTLKACEVVKHILSTVGLILPLLVTVSSTDDVALTVDTCANLIPSIQPATRSWVSKVVSTRMIENVAY